MTKQSNSTLHQREYKHKREPITRTWFLSHGYTKADTRYTNGCDIWLHPKTNDVFSTYRKLKLNLMPHEKHKKTKSRYLSLDLRNGYHIYLARLKYLTFKGEIPAGYTIDHIDGNSLNNDIRNLRAVTPAINRRDGGFLRKLRNHGIIVAMYPGIIIQGYERMAQWKATHKDWQYKRLSRKELLQIFIGPKFTVNDPELLMDRDISGHCEI